MAEQLDYLNGRKSLGGYAARNTAGKLSKNQRRLENVGQRENFARDKITTLAALNKMALFMIKIVNKLMEAKIAVVFVSFGSGALNSITRKDGCLFNQIPPALFNKQVDTYKPFQEVFDKFWSQSQVSL